MKKFILPSIGIVLAVTGILFMMYGTTPEPAKVEPVAVAQAQPKPATIEELLADVNAERAKVGVAPLTIDPAINATAQRKADQVHTDRIASHVDKNGEHGYMYMKDAGIRCSYAGENLVTNSTMAGTITSDQAIESWMGSKPHHDAMLDPKNTTTGFGIHGWVIVEHFCQAA